MLKTLNVHIGSPDGNRKYIDGGLIFCNRCRHILGYLNGDGYRTIQMIIRCKCGQIGVLRTEIANKPRSIARMLRAKKMEYRCEKCGLPLFSLHKECIAACSFCIACKCGASYTKDISESEERKFVFRTVK